MILLFSKSIEDLAQLDYRCMVYRKIVLKIEKRSLELNNLKDSALRTIEYILFRNKLNLIPVVIKSY